MTDDHTINFSLHFTYTSLFKEVGRIYILNLGVKGLHSFCKITRSFTFFRNHVDSSLVKLWRLLFAHFVNLVKNIILMADEVADLFGPLLVSSDSVHRKEVSHVRIFSARFDDALPSHSRKS